MTRSRPHHDGAGACWCSGLHGTHWVEPEPDAWDLLDAAVVGSAWWAGALAIVVALLALVLVALGLRRITR